MKIKIEGVEELQIKLSRFSNFLGQEYNKTMAFKVAPYIIKKFREHILKHRTKSGYGYSNTKDLTIDYKTIKEKRWGHIYPILYASGKMFDDIKYFINTSWKHFAGKNRIKLTFGFKTLRSQKIAGYHVKGIKRKDGIIIRNPWFVSTGEKTWITKIIHKATKDALKKARLKTRTI